VCPDRLVRTVVGSVGQHARETAPEGQWSASAVAVPALGGVDSEVRQRRNGLVSSCWRTWNSCRTAAVRSALKECSSSLPGTPGMPPVMKSLLTSGERGRTQVHSGRPPARRAGSGKPKAGSASLGAISSAAEASMAAAALPLDSPATDGAITPLDDVVCGGPSTSEHSITAVCAPRGLWGRSDRKPSTGGRAVDISLTISA